MEQASGVPVRGKSERMIEVCEVSKSYGSLQAVSGISFEIERGEVVGFIGPNAAGKSTTMRILTCYIPADSGDARVAGFDVLDESMEVRSRLGYLPEDAPLYPDMRVDAFLNYVASIRDLKGESGRSAVSRVVDICGLAKVYRRQVGELSKGYRQRVGLAQALIHDPDLLILDEPTSGLDPLQIREIRSLIKELGKEKTVILSTHILPEVEVSCNRIILIHKGRIIADAGMEEVIRKASVAEEMPSLENAFVRLIDEADSEDAGDDDEQSENE